MGENHDSQTLTHLQEQMKKIRKQVEDHLKTEEAFQASVNKRLKNNDEFHTALRPIADAAEGLSLLGDTITKLSKMAKPLVWIFIAIIIAYVSVVMAIKPIIRWLMEQWT